MSDREVVRMPVPILEILMKNLEVETADVYRVPQPLSLKRPDALYALSRPDLKDPPFVPAAPAALAGSQEEDIFALVRQGDILLHHPFDSFQPVVEFLKVAARDPSVLAIKMCLYRVGRNSPIVEALLEAVEEHKQVAVLVELKARFDEESNIEWARTLESAGAHVVYGLIGLKIHCKVALVVRREHDRIARYVHISTGNYNAVTAHLYTDIGILTVDEEVATDGQRPPQLFNRLFAQDRLPPSTGGAGESSGSTGGLYRAGNPARQRGPPGTLDFQDESAGRSENYPRSLPGIPGRRKGATSCARNLLPAARGAWDQ
jgi:polyphosphate kinase